MLQTVPSDIFILHYIACLWHVIARHAVHVEVVKDRQFSLLLSSVDINTANKHVITSIAKLLESNTVECHRVSAYLSPCVCVRDTIREVDGIFRSKINT